MTAHYLSKDTGQPTITGLILAGSAELKDDLAKSGLFDRALLRLVIAQVDVSYGGRSGLREAVKRAEGVLAGARYTRERTVLDKYFDAVNVSPDCVAYGAEDVEAAMAGDGLVDDLMCGFGPGEVGLNGKYF